MKTAGVPFFVYGTLRSRGRHRRRMKELGGVVIRPCFINGFLLGLKKANSVRPYVLPYPVTNRVEGELIEFPQEALPKLAQFERCNSTFPTVSETILSDVVVYWPGDENNLNLAMAKVYVVGRDIHNVEQITTEEAL